MTDPRKSGDRPVKWSPLQIVAAIMVSGFAIMGAGYLLLWAVCANSF